MSGDKGSRDPKDDQKALQDEGPDPFDQESGHDGATFAGLLSDVPAPKPARTEPGGRWRPGTPGPLLPGTVTPRRAAAPGVPAPPAAPAPAQPPVPPPPPAPALAEPELLLDEPLAAFPVVVDEDNPLGETGALPVPGPDPAISEVFGESAPHRPPARRPVVERETVRPVVPAAVSVRPAPRFGVPASSSFEEIVGPDSRDGSFDTAQTARPRRSSRGLLLVLLALVVVAGAAAGYLYRDALVGLLGLGAGRDEALATPAAQPVPEQPTAVSGPTDVAPTTADVAVSEPGAVVVEPPAGASVEKVPDEPVPATPANRVVGVSWQREGGLVLVVRTNGSVSPARVRSLRLEGPPREVVSITGIVAATDQESMAGDGQLVTRVRFGHHPETTPPELRLVLDLATPAARLTATETSGASLRLRLASSPQ